MEISLQTSSHHLRQSLSLIQCLPVKVKRPPFYSKISCQVQKNRVSTGAVLFRFNACTSGSVLGPKSKGPKEIRVTCFYKKPAEETAKQKAERSAQIKETVAAVVKTIGREI